MRSRKASRHPITVGRGQEVCGLWAKGVRQVFAAALPGFIWSGGGSGSPLPGTTQAMLGHLAAQDPMHMPREAAEFALRATRAEDLPSRKAQALLQALFTPVAEGGLGMAYDNERTRTVEEAWTDRQANCLTLTALYVQACRSIGIEARYGEPTNLGRWTRRNGLIRYERHLVASLPAPGGGDLVADFAPDFRRGQGRYVLAILSEARVRALWATNRAVECLEQGDLAMAERFARAAVAEDPLAPTGWNALGVVLQRSGRPVEAEEAYRKALLCDPMDVGVVGNLEHLLREAGRLDEASRFRAVSLKLRERDPFYHTFLASEALVEGRPQDALRHARAAARLRPEDPEFRALEADCRLALGDVAGAARALKAAVRRAGPAERPLYEARLSDLRR